MVDLLTERVENNNLDFIVDILGASHCIEFDPTRHLAVFSFFLFSLSFFCVSFTRLLDIDMMHRLARRHAARSQGLVGW